MYLDYGEIEKRTKFRLYIISHSSDLYLKDHECIICKGTGLDKVHKNKDGSYSGDLDSYCYKCGGIGYINLETDGMMKCYICNGSGKLTDCYGNPICNLCKGTGLINWIENILGELK